MAYSVTFKSFVTPKIDDCDADEETFGSSLEILLEHGHPGIKMTSGSVVSGIGSITFLTETDEKFKPHPKVLDDILELFSDGTGVEWEVTGIENLDDVGDYQEFNDFQRDVIAVYDDAEELVPEPSDIPYCVDDLLKFILIELSTKESCDSRDEAIRRIESVIQQLKEVKSQLEKNA